MLAYRQNLRTDVLPITVTTIQKLQESPDPQSADCITGTEIDMPAKKKPGVIATIVDLISRDKGASINEIVAALVKKFPDREKAGMLATCRIQASKHATSKEKDEKRGLVYFKRR